MYKFRSMRLGAQELQAQLEPSNCINSQLLFKVKDDPRITRVGRFIRRTSIDELPQLVNVLKRQMSLVGTRPPTVEEFSKYSTYEHRRISIKPGITGMWQTHGRNNITSFEEVVELDTEYIDNWSLWLDVQLMFRTVRVVFSQEGAY
jgi:lipopolysaccharide/colanic/teichoic acid biosynthesis glycosyltransferase